MAIDVFRLHRVPINVMRRKYMKNRVVVTGMGTVTPLGNDVNSFWNGIKEGKCGIDYITLINTDRLKVKVAGEVKDFKPEDYLDRKEAKRMDRYCQLALAAAKEAVEDSGLDLENLVTSVS